MVETVAFSVKLGMQIHVLQVLVRALKHLTGTAVCLMKAQGLPPLVEK